MFWAGTLPVPIVGKRLPNTFPRRLTGVVRVPTCYESSMPSPDPAHSPPPAQLDDDFDIVATPLPAASLLRHLTPTMRQLGATLVDQELWCLGGDARQGRQGPLIEYGFTRERSPSNAPGSTAYRLEHDGRELVVWGWGMAYAEKGVGAIFIRRSVFDPLILSDDKIPHIHHPAGFVPLLVHNRPPAVSVGRFLLSGLAEEFSRYEGWIQSDSRWGAEYREKRVGARIHGRGDGGGAIAYVPAEKLATAWDLLRRVV